MSIRAASWLAAAALLLTACGGGAEAADPAGSTGPATGRPVTTPGGAPSVAEGGQTAAPAPTPPPAAAPTAGPIAGPTAESARCTDPAAQALALARVNAVRARGATCGSQAYGAAAALTADGRLTQAAAAHSADMAGRNFFSHTGSDGSSIGTRLTRAGYPWSRAAENIAAGYANVATVVDGWVASPGHCANLMDPNLTQLVLACVAGPAGSPYSNYWTMTLARPR